MEKRLESLLYVFLYLVIYVFSQLIAITLIPFCNTIQRLINGNTDPESLISYFLTAVERTNQGSVAVLVASMVLSVLLFMWVMKIRRRPWKRAVLKRRLTAREVFASVFLAYGLNVAALSIVSQPFFERFATDYDSAMTSIVSGDFAVVFLVVGILAPIFEELMYRGVILSELSSARPFFMANLIQSIVFGVMHMNIIQGTYAAVIGFVLGYAYRLTGSIYMTMLTHFLFNASNLLIVGYINTLFGHTYFLASGAVALLAAFLLMSRLFRRSA